MAPTIKAEITNLSRCFEGAVRNMEDGRWDEVISTLRFAAESAGPLVERIQTEQAARMKTCRFCGERFLAPRGQAPDVDFCRSCYYDGRTHMEEPRVAPVIARIRERVNANVSVDHTGCGCFKLHVLLDSDPEGRMAIAMVSWRHRDSTEWEFEPGFPRKRSDRWYCAVFARNEDWWEQSANPIAEQAGLTDAGLVRFLMKHNAGKGA